MKIGMTVGALALVLTGCEPRSNDDTPESLARDPDRVKNLLRECRDDPSRAEDKRCRAASEAWRRRFFGNEKREEEPATPTKSPTAVPEDVDASAATRIDPTPWMAGS